MTRFALLDKYRRIWRLLPSPFDWVAIALVAGSVVGTFLEVLGIALLGVLLSELGSATPMPIGWVPIPDWLFELAPARRVFVIVGLCGAVFFSKNLFLAANAWVEATFAFRLQAWVSRQLIADSLHLDYEAAAKRAPSQYTTLLTTDLASVVYHTLLPGLTLLSEVVVVAGMFAYLAWTQTEVTFAVSAAVLAAGLLIAASSRTLMSRLSTRRQVLEDARMRQVQQMFANLRDVYIYGAGRQLQGSLHQGMSELAGVYRGHQMLSTGPRFLLEFAMVAILLVIIAVGLQTQERSTLVASVGVFAASGFRFLIGANRMLMSLQSMRFGDSAFERVWDTMAGTHAEAHPELPASHDDDWVELRACGLRYRHTRGEAAIGPVDLVVRRGELVGIMGPSGVGKSTLLELLSGLRRPQEGSVALSDPDGGEWTVTGPSSRIGYVGQSTGVLAASLRENVAFGLDLKAIDDKAIWEALRLARMDDFARSLPQQLETPLAEYGASLSGGQLQRIGIARALCRHSSFMLMDEPTSALDSATEAELVETLRQLADRCGIVIVSHRGAPLDACDRLYALEPGGLRPVRATPLVGEAAMNGLVE